MSPEATWEPAMMVRCPRCSTGYWLPDHLIGPGGARVRCPECGGAFVVPATERGTSEAANAGANARDDEDERPAHVAEATTTLEPTPATTVPGPPPTVDPTAIATALLDTLASGLGESLEAARARGTVLSDHGPAILDAYAEYRRRSGPGVSAAPFRAALRERWGVDLTSRAQA